MFNVISFLNYICVSCYNLSEYGGVHMYTNREFDQLKETLKNIPSTRASKSITSKLNKLLPCKEQK